MGRPIIGYIRNEFAHLLCQWKDGGQKRNMKRIHKLKKYLPLYCMLLPGIIYLIINNYLPISGLLVAFKQFNYKKGILHSPFVGLDNFKFLFMTKDAWIITRNTVLYNLVFIVLGTVLAIAVAIFLNDLVGKRKKRVYQTVILLPYLISMVIVSYLVFALLNTGNGYINKAILESLGSDPVSWYNTPKYWPFILTIVYLWKTLGYKCILYYSSIVGISSEYYEAASLDGASRWQKVIRITLPELKPLICTLTLLSISKIFYSDFGLFYQVTRNQGAIIDVTNTIDTYVYRGLMESHNMGMASAASFYQAIVGFLLVVAANFITKKFDPDSALY